MQTQIFDRIIQEQIPILQKHKYLKKDKKQNYDKLLGCSNLKVHEQISYRNVKILEKQHIHEIYTISNNPRLPHLVFIHGFGGTSMTALRLFQHLNEHFQVHALDLFGIGYSSSGTYDKKFTPGEAKDYFVDAIEEWRKTVGIYDFYLAGHSFGGYISSYYAIKYQQRIRHLFLVSPAGASPRKVSQKKQKQEFKQQLWIQFTKKVFAWSLTPSWSMSLPFVGSMILDYIVKQRINIPESERNNWKLYFKNISSQPKGSEQGFFKIFEWPVNTRLTTIQNLVRENPNLPFGIDFYFGDADWISSRGPWNLVNQNFNNIYLSTIQNSGHQIIFDNPVQLCNKIKERVYDTRE